MHPGILIGAGFVLGSAGLKLATSAPAKRAYVKGLVCGMKAKESIETVIDEAKAEFDDIVAEASFAHNASTGAASEANEEARGEELSDEAGQACETAPANEK